MSIVQLSRFVFLCRSFQATAFIFYQRFVHLSRTFFIFLFRFVDHFRVFLSDSLFRLSHPNCFVNNFFIFSNSFNFPNYSDCFQRLKQESFFIPAAVPPPRLCTVLNRSLFSVVFSAVPQRLSYHIISVWNCQCFFYYLYNSDNLYNFLFSSSLLLCFSYFFYYFHKNFLLYRLITKHRSDQLPKI